MAGGNSGDSWETSDAVGDGEAGLGGAGAGSADAGWAAYPGDDAASPSDATAGTAAGRPWSGESVATESAATRSAATPAVDTGVLPEPAAESFQSRWDAIQSRFVDDPRAAVAEADRLVAEVTDMLTTRFAQHRAQLEQRWTEGQPATEELRQALQRYRDFFRRLLTNTESLPDAATGSRQV